MLFENTTLITKEILQDFIKFSYYKINKNEIKKLIITSIILMLVGIILFGSELTFVSIPIFLIGLCLLIHSIFGPKLTLKLRGKSFEEISATYRFFEDTLEIITPIETATLKYSAILSCYDDEKNICLVHTNKQSVYIMCKDSFTIGNANDFITFIKDRI